MWQNRQHAEEAVSVPIRLTGDAHFVHDAYESGKVLRTHWHDVDQLIYASTGVITVTAGDGIWVVPPARAVWVPATTPHSIEMTGEVGLTSIYVRPGTAAVTKPRCCVVHVSQLLRELILRGAALGKDPRIDGHNTAVELNRNAVMFDEIQAAGIAPLELLMPSDSRALEVADGFLKDPAQRITRGEWARRVGASERTLERLFLRETHTTLGRWQAQARLLEALRRLATGETVTRVAIDVGFDTPSAFISMFRRALGTTPAKYFAAPDLGTTSP